MIRHTLLLIVLLCGFVNTTHGQHYYYPDDIGNIWVLESTDGAERMIYALKAAEVPLNAEEFRVLDTTTEVVGTSTAITSVFLLQVSENGMHVHSIDAEFGDIFGTAHVDYSPPAIFFPDTLQLGVTWETSGETEVNLVGPVKISMINEVVLIEDVDTPAGVFQDCVKIQVRVKTTTTLGATRSISYQWLAPNLGPVKFHSSQGIVFELASSNLLDSDISYDVNNDGIVNILDIVLVGGSFGGSDPKADVNGDGRVNILDLILIADNFAN